MEPDLSDLRTYLTENNSDGYLLYADGNDPDQRYISGFSAPDPFLTVYTDMVHILVSTLEYGRAKRTARADTVERLIEYNYRENIDEYGNTEGTHQTIFNFLESHDVRSVIVPENFPVGTADGLRSFDITVDVDYTGRVDEIRARKMPEEIQHIQDSQHANERAMEKAEELLRSASIRDDGTLMIDGEILTSERIKQEIEITLLKYGCALDETIVACGADAADPHDRGSGPLQANLPIIIDIFPRSKETGYYADMTRTFCVGEPSPTIQEWYDLTLEAQEAALEAVQPGISGRVVHDAVCDIYEEAGLPTYRDDETTETGFIHTTGHGVGLEIHEYPRISLDDNELQPGHVVSIEPGLYDPEHGGVRIEDLIAITDDGYENLTSYPKSFVI